MIYNITVMLVEKAEYLRLSLPYKITSDEMSSCIDLKYLKINDV